MYPIIWYWIMSHENIDRLQIIGTQVADSMYDTLIY